MYTNSTNVRTNFSTMGSDRTLVSLSSTPVPRWFYRNLEGKWIPLEEAVDKEVEEKFEQSGGCGWAPVLDYTYQVDFAKMALNATAEKSRNIEKQIKRKLRRGTWFWQDDDGSWVPFETDVSQKLENAFLSGTFTTVEVSRKPPRIVSHLAGGTFRQMRKTKGGNSGGRAVCRGYNGEVIEKVLEVPNQTTTTTTTTYLVQPTFQPAPVSSYLPVLQQVAVQPVLSPPPMQPNFTLGGPLYMQ